MWFALGCVLLGCDTHAKAEDETTLYVDGIDYMGQKNYVQAEASFRKSIHIDPRYKEAWQALADVLKLEG